MNIKSTDFQIGTKAMVLFEQMNGGQSLLNVMSQDMKSLAEMVQIMACAYQGNDYEGYANFFNHPDYDMLVYNRPLLTEIFKKLNDDVEKKLQMFPTAETAEG